MMRVQVKNVLCDTFLVYCSRMGTYVLYVIITAAYQMLPLCRKQICVLIADAIHTIGLLTFDT